MICTKKCRVAGRLLIYLLVFISVIFSSNVNAQELAAKLILDSDDIIRSKKDNHKEFVFELSGIQASIVVNTLENQLASVPEVIESRFSKVGDDLYKGSIQVVYDFGAIEMIRIMMTSGVEHIERDGVTTTVKDLRAEIRAKQAKKY